MEVTSYRPETASVITYVSKWKKRIPYIIAYGVLGLTTLPIILMYLWLLLSSFSKQMKYGFIPVHFTLENWKFLWMNVEHGGGTLPSIWTATWNSFIFSSTLTILEVIIGVMAGYVLARIEFPGRQALMKTTLLLHAFPSVALLIAVYYILNFMGLFDSLWGVVLVKTALQIPMTAWIVKGFFDDVSWDVEWAGLIDGCNRLKVWFTIVLPLIKPGIAAISIFSFLSGWSEFLLLYTFILSDENVTLSSYLQRLISDPNLVNYGLLSAVSLFYMLPVLLFFIFTQKSLMQVSVGGGKSV
ncbi:carbohydrate ABC transporter permease [Bacillus methanolicus]|uniref:ABC transporter n=1 Tax=Bacillus methanolicus (strain MGA3 / ATCC 53907) TaxID=796606 RepID=I3EBV7_BACMM|nr:carbohydrate ABC transporter permease [Bacillus methanolicus]AIE61657.1 ABC transporter [Bacillus methanolicus MGA3]EIJ83978.1 binding-protein-dependent transport systems inner membrane component [Bacillus methanolicus MGA3]